MVAAGGLTDRVSRRAELARFVPLADRELLVVDGSPEITSLVRDIFTSCGCRVTTAGSGTEAVSLLAARRFDLVILDLALPGVTGWQVIEFVQSRVPELAGRVMVLTGLRYDQGTVAAIWRCRIPCVFKPCGVDELRQMACRVLASHSSPCTAA